MIDRTLEWIEEVNEEFDIKPNRVLEVGSLDHNGNPRHFFPDSEYIGIDAKDGDNVDIVMDAKAIATEFTGRRFDAVLALHVFEHIDRFWQVLNCINIVTTYEGYLYVAMPEVGYPVHNHPGDYWRCTEQSMREVIMSGYEVLDLEHAKSTYGKHPVIHCLGVKS
jgi:predicted SAM-dependent methyltransferase